MTEPKLSSREARDRFRRYLKGPGCIQPASVFDPVSARIADSLGYEVGMLPGSVASAVILGAPDLALITLTEIAQLVRRITRASSLSLLVDADHGYGNALNVMRTVEELENAGASALTIEDTNLPRPFKGQGSRETITTAEMVGKLKAALHARRDPSLVIIGRTSVIPSEGAGPMIERVRAYSSTGVDAIFLVGITSKNQIEVAHTATSLPLMLGGAPPDLDDSQYLASQGVRLKVLGHRPFSASIDAVYRALLQQRGHLAKELTGETSLVEAMIKELLREGLYGQMQRDFLNEPKG